MKSKVESKLWVCKRCGAQVIVPDNFRTEKLPDPRSEHRKEKHKELPNWFKGIYQNPKEWELVAEKKAVPEKAVKPEKPRANGNPKKVPEVVEVKNKLNGKTSILKASKREGHSKPVAIVVSA